LEKPDKNEKSSVMELFSFFAIASGLVPVNAIKVSECFFNTQYQ
jgi:hypothetical protein